MNFNSDLKNDLVWQYACERMVAEKEYTSITVLLAFDHNANQVWFDGIQLVKDEFGESYTYDSDGNVVSVQDLRNKNSTYEYASNDLTKAILPNGAELKYTYDDYHNVKESTSGEGIRICDSDGCGLYVGWKLRRERYRCQPKQYGIYLRGKQRYDAYDA